MSQCPKLEALGLSHGRKYLSRGETMPPFPSLLGAFEQCRLPTSLVMLHLQDIIVQPTDFAACHLPELALLRMIDCGDQAAESAHAMRLTCPKLTPAGCIITGDTTGYFKLTQETHPRVKAVHCCFPADDLHGLSLDGVIDVLVRGYDTYYRNW